jgi:hypothetical protein
MASATATTTLKSSKEGVLVHSRTCQVEILEESLKKKCHHHNMFASLRTTMAINNNTLLDGYWKWQNVYVSQNNLWPFASPYM